MNPQVILIILPPEGISSLLFELHQAEQNILIVVTHSLELASRFGRRFELEAGRCAEV